MNSRKLSLRNLSVLLAMVSWLGTAGRSTAAPSTPTTDQAPSNQASSNAPSNANSFPKQSDVSPFDPNTAAVVKGSEKASPALLNSQVQAGVKVSADPGPIQNGTKVLVGPGPVQKGAKVGISPGPVQKKNKLTKSSRLTKVGASPGPIQKGTKVGIGPGPIQKGVKVGVGPGPIQKLNAGAQTKGGGMGDMSQSQQLKLQMNMDRKSKLSNTLSNVMKKNQDTQNGVVGNMK